MIIYKATNIINDKSYIGQTVGSLDSRKNKHYNEAFEYQKTRFHKAIVRYGLDAFIWSIIEDGINDLQTLDEREVYWVAHFDTYNNGYNDTKGGHAIRGYRFTKVDRKKMSLSHLGKSNGPHSKETKKKISESQKGSNNSMFGRRGKNNPRTGTKHSKESIQKMILSSAQYKYILEGFNQCLNFISAKEICKHFKDFNETTLLRHIKNNKVYKGWKITREPIKCPSESMA